MGERTRVGRRSPSGLVMTLALAAASLTMLPAMPVRELVRLGLDAVRLLSYVFTVTRVELSLIDIWSAAERRR